MIFEWNEQSVVSLRAPQPKNSSQQRYISVVSDHRLVMRPRVCSMYKNKFKSECDLCINDEWHGTKPCIAFSDT